MKLKHRSTITKRKRGSPNSSKGGSRRHDAAVGKIQRRGRGLELVKAKSYSRKRAEQGARGVGRCGLTGSRSGSAGDEATVGVRAAATREGEALLKSCGGWASLEEGRAARRRRRRAGSSAAVRGQLRARVGGGEVRRKGCRPELRREREIE